MLGTGDEGADYHVFSVDGMENWRHGLDSPRQEQVEEECFHGVVSVMAKGYAGIPLLSGSGVQGPATEPGTEGTLVLPFLVMLINYPLEIHLKHSVFDPDTFEIPGHRSKRYFGKPRVDGHRRNSE